MRSALGQSASLPRLDTHVPRGGTIHLGAEYLSYARQTLSPTALKVLKQSFNADTEHFAGIGQMAYSALKMFSETAEAREGITAFNEKRSPDFSAYRGN